MGRAGDGFLHRFRESLRMSVVDYAAGHTPLCLVAERDSDLIRPLGHKGASTWIGRLQF